MWYNGRLLAAISKAKIQQTANNARNIWRDTLQFSVNTDPVDLVLRCCVFCVNILLRPIDEPSHKPQTKPPNNSSHQLQQQQQHHIMLLISANAEKKRNRTKKNWFQFVCVHLKLMLACKHGAKLCRRGQCVRYLLFVVVGWLAFFYNLILHEAHLWRAGRRANVRTGCKRRTSAEVKTAALHGYCSAPAFHKSPHAPER